MIEYHLFCTFKKEETNVEDKCIISLIRFNPFVKR